MRRMLSFVLVVGLGLVGCGSPVVGPAGVGGGGRRDLPALHRATVVAARFAEIDSPLMTQVASLALDGQRVKQGDPICQLDLNEKEDDRKRLEAQLVSLQVDLEGAAGKIPREEELARLRVEAAELALARSVEELDKERDQRDWQKITEEEETDKVRTKEARVLGLRLEAQKQLEGKGFSARLERLQTQLDADRVRLEASHTAWLLPWLEAKEDEKAVFKAEQARQAASAALDLARLEGVSQVALASVTLASARLDREDTSARLASVAAVIAKAVITAPVPGVAVRTMTFTGTSMEKVAEGDKVYPSISFLSILDMERIGIQIAVDQRFAGEIQPGWRVRFRPDAYPEYLLTGVATECEVMAGESQVTYPEGPHRVMVKALLDQTPPGVLAGFSGAAECFPPEAASAPSNFPLRPGDRPGALRRLPLDRKMTVTGEIKPARRSMVGAPFPGKLAGLIDDGVAVKKGEEVARLDASELDKTIGELRIQVDNKTEELVLQKEKNRLERERQERKVLIAEGALAVARLEHTMLLKRRDENEIITLEKNRDLIAAKLELARESARHERDLQKRGLKSDLEVLAADLEVARQEREKAVTAYKLKLAVSGPTARQVRLSQLAVRKAETDCRVVRAEADLASFSAAIQERKLEADLNVKRLERDEKEARLARITISSPQDGVVILPEVWKEGDMSQVKIGDQVRRTPFLHVADMGSLEIRLLVSEMDIKFLRVGAKAEISIKSAPGRVFPGWVRQIGLVADANLRERQDPTVEVMVALIDPATGKGTIDPVFRPGSSCDVTIPLYREENALVVPFDAVVPGVRGPLLIAADGGFRPFSLAFSDGLRGFVASGSPAEGFSDDLVIRFPERLP